MWDPCGPNVIIAAAGVTAVAGFQHSIPVSSGVQALGQHASLRLAWLSGIA